MRLFATFTTPLAFAEDADRRILLLLFTADVPISVAVSPHAADELAWVSAEFLYTYAMPPADIAVLDAVQRVM